jgi:hypothetical protein
MSSSSPHFDPSSSSQSGSPLAEKRPGISRSNSSFGSFMNIRGLDRYGEEWGNEALTLLGELELAS